MDLITTHVNADFDGLSSIVAAKKLYPDSRLYLPASQERGVRDFLSLTKDIIRFETDKDFNPSGIGRLVIVDTRHSSRIGRAAELVAKGVEAHIYDHHPRMKNDIVATVDVYLKVGATVTILADLIKKNKLGLSPLEATIMLIGIYEETGSLTYRSTTKMDVDMVSFLLSCGANLNVVSNYLNREMSEDELSFLIKLINATERVYLKGVTVSIAVIDSGDFSGEIGMLVHKLMEIESIPLLFVFVKTPAGRINLIARSKLEDVDVNKVLAHFGGGGHPTAAYAKIESGDLEGLKKDLLNALGANIKVKVYAGEMMEPDPPVADIDESVDKVRALLVKRSIEGVFVTDGKKIAGVATMDRLKRAVRNGFGHSRVKGYMSGKVVSVSPKTPLYVVKELMLKKDSTLIAVMNKRRLVGAINRTDVLKRVHDGIFGHPHPIEKRIVQNITNKFEGLLPKRVVGLLKRIGLLANRNGYSSFIVGGLVRDLLMGVKNLDLDIVIEGDAINFAGILARGLKGTLVAHRRFGTASVYLKDRLKIDLATARKEVYETPAALPTVEFSSLKNDLIRRDFTINSMAASLNKENFGQLIDFFGGARDLKRGSIRVLHDSSFIDDPTRIFRAVRFEQRFGFEIDGHTRELIKHAISKDMFDKTEKQRIRDELVLILKEHFPLKALRRMDELHELKFIHPKIRYSKTLEAFFERIDDVLAWYETAHAGRRAVDAWLLYLMALVDRLNYKELEGLCGKFVFANRDRLRLESFKRDSDKIIGVIGKGRKASPSRIHALLEPLAYEVILAAMAKASAASAARERIEEFFARYHGKRLAIKGHDLLKLGLKPGPKFKEILERMLREKVDGRLKTKRDELEYAKRLVASLKTG